MQITVNGDARTVNDGTTIAALLQELGLGPGRIAVEVNQEIVPKATHGEARLAEGDRVEIVSFVGGG